jgi:single-stranded-DNA-specific exonuclease
MLGDSTLPGVRALVRASGLDGKPLTAGRVGFILAPRLNAVGRLGHALRGVELLTTDDEHEANAIARELEELNRRRQDIDKATLADARRQLDALDLDETFGIVLHADGWHPGVIGIVASRIVEETARPAVLVAVDGGIGKGSGRSIPAFDLHAALAECDAEGLFHRFGGHRAAAGITIDAAKLPAFAERFNAVARARLTPDDLVPELRVDLELPIEEACAELEALLKHFEPFGVGNPAPTLVSRNVRLAGRPRLVGDDGLKLMLDCTLGPTEAIGWNLASRAALLEGVHAVDIAYRLERDEYKGQSRLQARLIDVAPAGA